MVWRRVVWDPEKKRCIILRKLIKTVRRHMPENRKDA